jgi:tetratricopeptide (TPR) repeat protein
MQSNAVPRPEPAAERAARMMMGLEWVMVPVLLALAFMLASFAVRNSDFWMHLATGRLIADGNYHFGTDPYSFATEGKTWVNHSWLFDLLLYQAYKLNPDHSAVVYIKAGLVALIALMMWIACRPAPKDMIVPGTKMNPTGWIAGIIVGLAIVAMGPRLVLQPTLVSYLFTVVTLFILLNSPRWPAYALPASLGVLFAVWVNLDQWFFIGPALVALWLLGEWLQQFVPGAEQTEMARVKALGLTLGVGLAACLINPHHIKAFTSLPMEVVPNVSPQMMKDKAWAPVFASTVDVLYTNQVQLGRSIPGLCYWLVMVLGVASFVLNYRAPRASFIVTWLALALLPLLLSYRLIPFFVVVGAPIAVLNFNAFFARLPYRKGVTFVPAEQIAESPTKEAPTPAAAAAKTDAPSTAITATPQEGWWPGASETAATPDPAATATAPAPSSSAALGGELTLTPETLLAMGGVMGRLLTVVVGIVAVAACWPGWLHAKSPNPRRVEWVLTPDPAYVQVAERLGKWRESGQLPPDARGLALDINMADYCAWYAPSVHTFMDNRFPLTGQLSADLMQVKRGLNERATDTADPTDFSRALRDHKINYLITSIETEAGGRELLAELLVGEDDEWVLWYHNGRMAVFGWHDPAGPEDAAQKDPLRMDLVALALGDKAERVPPADRFNVPHSAPPESHPESSLMNRFMTPPPPPRPTESVSALLYWLMRDRAFIRAQRESVAAFDFAFQAARIGMFAQPNYMTPFTNPTQNARMQTAQRMALAHPLPTAVSVLAVREARLGVLAHPNEGYPYLVLALAYNNLLPVNQQLHLFEQVTALHQALDRLTPEELEDERIGPMVSACWLRLAELHSLDARDLAEEALGHVLAMYDRSPPLLIPETQREKAREGLQQMQDRFKTELLAARDNFQLALETAKQRNAPPASFIQIALQHGLVREAIKIIEDPANSTKPDPILLQFGVSLYLKIGRVEDAQQILDRLPDYLREQPAFRQLQLNAWMAAGEYARAGKAYEELIALAEKTDDPKAKAIKAAKVFQQLHFSIIEPSSWPMMLATVPAGSTTLISVATQMVLERQAKAEALGARAMLALEEGDIPTARKYFHDSTEMGVVYQGIEYAAVYRFALERANAKK